MSEINRHHITKEEFSAAIAPYKDSLIIQRLGVHFGSMLYFKMSGQPSSIDKERLQLTLEGDWWTLLHNGTEVSRSTSITREFVETTLAPLLIGKTFLDLTLGDRVTLRFSDGWSVEIQPEHAAVSDYDLLFSFYLPGRTCIVLTDDLLPQLAISQESEDNGDTHKPNSRRQARQRPH